MAQEPDGEQRLRTTPTSPAEPPSGQSPASPIRPEAPTRPVSSTDRPAPPPRPGVSYSAPAPIAVTPPLPSAVRLGRALWLVGFVAGLSVLVTSFLSRDAHLERLRTVVDRMAPGGEADALTISTAIVFWGSLGTLLLVILLEAAALAIVMRRHGWARWVMIPLLLGHVLATFVAAAFLVPENDAGSYVVLLWGTQLLLSFAGLVLLLVPSSGAWLRSRGRP